MRRPIATVLAGFVAVALAAAPRRQTPPAISRAAALFDLSPPLSSMEPFVPGTRIVIHPAHQSQPERAGKFKGPGAGLGSTPPAPAAGRPAGRAGRAPASPPRPAPIVAPPAPEIPAAAVA